MRVVGMGWGKSGRRRWQLRCWCVVGWMIAALRTLLAGCGCGSASVCGGELRFFPSPTPPTHPSSTAHPSPPHPKEGCRVRLESGRVLTARAVVWTPANRRPVLPAWTRQLASAEGAADAGATDGQQPAVDGTLGGTVSLPPGIATSDCVDLRGAELEGRRVAVVGGGMSAGLLAAGAAERGAHVMLVCRRC